MARFRKIDPRIWNDAKFASLSNEAKLLFIYLLTSPQMTVLGALPMRDTSVAAELNIPYPIRYGIRYKELYDRGIAEYDERGLFWVKNFLKYNSPDNPKVVLSWAGAVDLLPECPLLEKILNNAKTFCNQKGSAYTDAFENGIGNCMPNGMGYGMPYGMPYKEKEKEKEKENIYTHPAPQDAPTPTKKVSKILKPEGILQDDWEAFLKLRKQKRLPLTQKALDLMLREADKAGLSPQEMINACLEHSWAGFKADWDRGQNSREAIEAAFLRECAEEERQKELMRATAS